MHRHRSRSTLRRFKLLAWHFLFNIFFVAVWVGVLLYGALQDQRHLLIAGVSMMGGWVFSVIVFFVRRSSVRCPLCMAPTWGSQKCVRNTKAKRALGLSYRLGVAISMITKGHYRCPYCGEPFSARETRER